MSTHRLVQNFSGRRALIYAPTGRAMDALAPTLRKLGLKAEMISDCPIGPSVPAPIGICADRDILFIDGDMALPTDEPSSQRQEIARPLIPIVGLVGIEAPSRLKALLCLGATAFLTKPIHGGTIYSALYLAVNEFNRKQALADAVEDLHAKRSKRTFVMKAVIAIMQANKITDDAAYGLLRKESMRCRLSIEDYSEQMLQVKSAARPVDHEDRARRVQKG